MIHRGWGELVPGSLNSGVFLMGRLAVSTPLVAVVAMRQPPPKRASLLIVAQPSSLLGRGFAIRRRSNSSASREFSRTRSNPTPSRLEVGDTAGWKPALQPGA